MPDLGALLLSLAVALAVFARTRAVGLIGWDSLPEVASSRIRGWSDFFATFVERTAEGYYPFKFYRPVFNLSLALDHALWGIDPVGYQLSSALLFGACGFALYRLARGLLGAGARDVGPWIALAIFFVAPFHLDVVAIVSRRMDLIAGLFICLALASQLRRCRDTTPRVALLPALFTLAAIGAKEIAVVVPPLVFLLVLLYARPETGRRLWRRAALATVPHVAAIALCIAARLAAFGELGGHPTTRLAGAIDLLPLMLGHELLAQLGGAIDGPHLVVGIGTLLATVILCAWLVFRPDGVAAGPARSALAAAAIALAWLVGCAALLGTVGMIQSWYLLVPRQGFALLLGAIAQLLVAAVRVKGGPARVAADLCLAGIAALVLVQAVASPLFREPRQLIEATQVADDYLANLRARIDSAPHVSIVGHPTPPLLVRLAEESQDGPATTALTWYTVQAWADLVYRDRQLIVLPRSSAAPLVEVTQKTTVIELHPRYARLAAMNRRTRNDRADGIQRPAGADARSIKEAMKRLRQVVDRFKNRQRDVDDPRARPPLPP